MAYLRLHLLGAPQFERDGERLHFERRRALALGIYLAVTGTAHSRDALTTLFWPEAGARSARASLRRVLHIVGRTLGEEFVRTEEDQISLQARGNLWMDLEQFRSLVADCHRHNHPADVVCPDCLPLLTQAADLYRDDFLAGFTLPDSPDFDRWQFFQAEQARVEMALVLELLTRGHIDQGRFSHAIVYAQRRLAFDPLYEPAHRQLMQLYAWTGQRGAAQRQYDLCTRLLAQELGVSPDDETEALNRTIRAVERLRPPPAAPSLPPPPTRTPPVTSHEDDVRPVTVVSIGLTGDEEAEEAATRGDQVQRLVELVTEIVLRYEGYVERVVGEDILVIFGRDRVHEDDAERGVLSALDVLARTTQAAVPVRIGVNTGMAYCRRQGPGMVAILGGVAGLATRLRNRAQEHPVIVGRNTYLATRGLFDYTPLQVQLPSTHADITAYGLDRRRTHAVKRRGVEGLEAELVGRDRELSLLQTAFAAAQQGEGQVVTIVGAAGVGKSRLVAELARGAGGRGDPDEPSVITPTKRPLWLEGRGVEHAMESAYSLFTDMLRAHFDRITTPGMDPAPVPVANRVADALQTLAQTGLLPEHAADDIGPPFGRLLSLHFGSTWDGRLEGLSADEVRRRTFAAVQSYIIALSRQQPLVLVFEDLQWADGLSLTLIESLLDVLPDHPILLVALYRREANQTTRDLASVARRICATRLTDLALHELSPEHSRRMLASLLAIEQLPPAIRDEILVKAQGNPLFLEEIVRSLIDTGVIYHRDGRWRGHPDQSRTLVPASLQSVVRSQVDRLDPDQQLYLRTAAVYGRLFRPHLVTQMLPPHVDAQSLLDSLTARGFVYKERRVPQQEFSFRHVLVRDAIYQALPRTQVIDLHRRAGQVLEATYADALQPHVEELAHHYALGEVTEQAVVYLLRAGQKAQHAYLNEEALAFFNRALAQLDSQPAGANLHGRLAALRGLGEVYATLGNLLEAEPALRQAAQIADELDLPAAERVQLTFPLCHLYRWFGRYQDLIRLGQDGIARLDAAGNATDCPEAVILLTYLAGALYSVGQRRRYRTLAGLMVEHLRRIHYQPYLITTYAIAGWWYRDAKRVPEALQWMAEIEQAAHDQGDRRTVGYLYSVAGYWLNEAFGDFAAVCDRLEQAVQIGREIGDDVLTGYALTFLGYVRYGHGRLAEAEELQREALAIHSANGARMMSFLNREGIGFVRLCLDDWSGVIAVLEEALALADELHLGVHGVHQSRLTLAYAYDQVGRRDEAVALCHKTAVGDEADGDGQVWIAFALAAIERILDDPAAFRAECRRIAAARPAADPLPLVQWWLHPARPATVMSSSSEIPSHDADWAWVDPFADCAYTCDPQGVTIFATNYYRDLWFNNVSAPRFMHPVTGDFVLEACAGGVSLDYPAQGGLVLWQDAHNYLRLGWGTHGPDILDLMGCIDNQDLYLGRGRLPTSGQIWLRLERSGNTVSALCSADRTQWFGIGTVDFPVAAALEVGIFGDGMIQRWAHPGAYSHGAAIRFERIRLCYRPRRCPIAPSILSTSATASA